MADVQRASLVSLFEPSSQYPDSNKTSFLSFAALADFNSQQRVLHSNAHNTWPGALNWKMGHAPIYQSRPEGEAETNALEAFDLNDYYHYNLDSPQSHFAITPSDRSSTGYILGDAGAIPPAFSSSSYSSIDVGHQGESASDARNIFSSGACSSTSLNSKTSHASFTSSISAQSEYFLTPRQSTASNPYSWEDVSGVVGISPATSQYPAGWTGEPNTKPALRQSRSSVWSSNSAVDVMPLSLTDALEAQGHEEEVWTGATPYPSINVSYPRSPSGCLNPGSLQPPAAFAGRDLASTFDMSSTCNNGEPFSAQELNNTSPSLLPPAKIVGNVSGWESSSPTCPSMADFQTAAMNHAEMYSGQYNSTTMPEAGPSGLAAAYLSVPGGTAMRKARSTDGIELQTAERTRALFAFHPADIPTTMPLDQAGPYDPIPGSAQAYFPVQPTPPPLMTRRNASRLQVRIPSSTAGSSRYSLPMSRAHTQPGPLDPAMMYTPPPPTAPYNGSITPTYYYPLPTTQEAEYMQYPAAPPQQPSVLASAPGGVHVAPPLSATTIAQSQQALTPSETSRPRTCSDSRGTPCQPILTSQPLLINEPASIPSPEPIVEAVKTRPIASLPTKRKASQPKSRKASGAKAKAAEAGVISFGSFINYTAKDAAVIQAGVAPSGSKTKRRIEDDADRPAKRSRSAESS